jgi:peptide deformylase
MAHLKKLSQVLNKIKPVQILPITIYGLHKVNLLECGTIPHTTITKTMHQYEIPSLLKTIENAGLASLSSNQSILKSSFFVMHSKLIPDKWSGYSGSDYKVYINPVILDASDEVTQGFEECGSLPYLFAQVERSRSISVQYLNIEGEYEIEELHDFPARVFQHEADHLSGFLMTSFSVSYGRIHSNVQSKTPALIKALEEYKDRLAEVVEQVEKLAQSKSSTIGDNVNKKDKQFIERVIVDEEFEQEFRDVVITTLEQDYNKLV